VTAEHEFDLICSSGGLELLTSLRRLLACLVRRLRFRGRLALHLPNNLYEPNRVIARMIAADGPWARTLVPVAKTRPFSAAMEELYGLLSPICTSVEIWETTYLYALNGVEAIIDFMKPRSLAPFISPLDPHSRNRFLERLLRELERAYPAQRDGKVLFRFPRTFVLAQR
jgi:trans-aconitate 2-methyltransferase